MKLNNNKVGLTTGIVAAIIHLLWAVIIALGWGQSVTDWLLKTHLVISDYTITDFSLGLALILIVQSFVVWYILGWLLAWVWNWVNRA